MLTFRTRRIASYSNNLKISTTISGGIVVILHKARWGSYATGIYITIDMVNI